MTNPRLIKLMMMTTSDNDAEALVAMRKANDILKRDGKNWEEVLAGTPAKPDAPRKPKPKAEPKPEPKPKPAKKPFTYYADGEEPGGSRFFYDTAKIHRALDDAWV